MSDEENVTPEEQALADEWAAALSESGAMNASRVPSGDSSSVS